MNFFDFPSDIHGLVFASLRPVDVHISFGSGSKRARSLACLSAPTSAILDMERFSEETLTKQCEARDRYEYEARDLVDRFVKDFLLSTYLGPVLGRVRSLTLRLSSMKYSYAFISSLILSFPSLQSLEIDQHHALYPTLVSLGRALPSSKRTVSTHFFSFLKIYS